MRNGILHMINFISGRFRTICITLEDLIIGPRISKLTMGIGKKGLCKEKEFSSQSQVMNSKSKGAHLKKECLL